jgi:hypothetical protein
VTQPSDFRAPIPPSECVRCGHRLESEGIVEFRTGGTGGGMKLLFGEWAELGEGKLPLELLVCQSCRSVELRMT